MVELPPPEISLDPRAWPRFAIDLPGEIVLRDGPHPCVVVEISCGGALLMVEGLSSTSAGAAGLLRCGTLDLLFDVVRAENGVLAVRFAEDLAATDPEDDLDALERKSLARRFFRALDVLSPPETC